jgi:hypothetical protein
MLFGSQEAFAIDAYLLEIYGEWTYGRLRFWTSGIPIGDFDDTSDLATSARWGRTFLGASLRRTRADLDHMTPAEVYQLLYGRFVVAINAPPTKTLAGHWDRDPYVLDDVGESALRDKFAVVVVRRKDGLDRIIVNSFNDESVSETLVPSDSCDRIIDSYCTWVEELRAFRA